MPEEGDLRIFFTFNLTNKKLYLVIRMKMRQKWRTFDCNGLWSLSLVATMYVTLIAKHLYTHTSENIKKNHKLGSVELFSGHLAPMAYSYESSFPPIREMQPNERISVYSMKY